MLSLSFWLVDVGKKEQKELHRMHDGYRYFDDGCETRASHGRSRSVTKVRVIFVFRDGRLPVFKLDLSPFPFLRARGGTLKSRRFSNTVLTS